MAHTTETTGEGIVFWSTDEAQPAILISKVTESIILEQGDHQINIEISDLSFFLKALKQVK